MIIFRDWSNSCRRGVAEVAGALASQNPVRIRLGSGPDLGSTVIAARHGTKWTWSNRSGWELDRIASLGDASVRKSCQAGTRSAGPVAPTSCVIRQGVVMGVVSRGFTGRRRSGSDLPPGQYLTDDFPVLSAGPTPQIATDDWQFTVTTESGAVHRWDWDALMGLPAEEITRDIHCVTRWSKLGTAWTGVSLDEVLADVETAADFVMVHSYGGYTTNVPMDDLLDGRAWIAYEYDGEPLQPEHGGPARLLVPHLYFWKSAKWVRGLQLSDTEDLGFWESVGYHEYGDPWREQRYVGD